LIHPLKTFVGTPFFGNYAQEVTGHNTVLNNLIRKVMSGQPDFAVYDFINGQRLTTCSPIFVDGGKPVYFVFVITPTATIYSQINNVIFTERIEMFSLLAGVTAAIAVVILFVIKWSGTLEREVKRRTKELNESNQRLDVANEQLKVHERMQEEFINVAAHELRTPIQPILTLTEILRSEIIDTNQFLFRECKETTEAFR
jgi:signal transduction histidine kinase